MNEKAPGTALAVQARDFLPVFDIALAIERKNAVTNFVKQLMIEDTDFGKIPGVDKPTLLKPGAEKLVTFFGLSPEFITTAEVEDWTGAEHKGEPFFYYRYKCRLTRDGRVIGEGEGSANSWEVKYRYRWVPEAQIPPGLDKTRLPMRDSTISEFTFAVEKKETTGPYGKPAEYWKRFEDAIANKTAVVTQRKTKAGKDMQAWSIPAIAYRVPNADTPDVVNTLQKMAQKRALVAAVLIGVNASEFFTQDVEDMQIIEGTATVVAEPAKDQPKPEVKAAAPAGEKVSDEFFEDDSILKLKECDNIGDLTKVFNSMPVDVRRPGTKVFKAFSERREQLTPPGKRKAAAAQGGAQ